MKDISLQDSNLKVKSKKSKKNNLYKFVITHKIKHKKYEQKKFLECVSSFLIVSTTNVEEVRLQSIFLKG